MSSPLPQPFLRWAGSKRKLLSKLRPYWESGFSRYVEPFMGSACFFFSLKPEKAFLSDLNPHLVETFLSVKNHPEAVHNSLSQIPLGRDSYYALRADDK